MTQPQKQLSECSGCNYQNNYGKSIPHHTCTPESPKPSQLEEISCLTCPKCSSLHFRYKGNEEPKCPNCGMTRTELFKLAPELPKPTLHYSPKEGVIQNPDGTVAEWREVGELAKRNIVEVTDILVDNKTHSEEFRNGAVWAMEEMAKKKQLPSQHCDGCCYEKKSGEPTILHTCKPSQPTSECCGALVRLTANPAMMTYNESCSKCDQPCITKTPKSQSEYAKKKNEELEEIKKNVMPDFICEKCFGRIKYPYPENPTICNQCSAASQPDHSIDTDKMVEPAQPEECQVDCKCHDGDYIIEGCQCCEGRPSQLTEEDRGLLKNWKQNFQPFKKCMVACPARHFETLIIAIKGLLVLKDREAEERVKACMFKKEVNLESRIQERIDESVKKERESHNQLILKGLKLLDPKFENVFLRQVFDSVRDQILNPEPPKDNH